MLKPKTVIHSVALVIVTTAVLSAAAPAGAILCIRGEATFTLATGTFEFLAETRVEVEAYLFDSTDRFDFLDNTASFPMQTAAGFTMRAGGETVFQSSDYSLVASVFDTTTVSVSGGSDDPRPVLGILQINCPSGVVDVKSLPALVDFLQGVPDSCGMLLILDERTADAVLGTAEGAVTFETGPICDVVEPPPVAPSAPPVPTAPQEPVIDDGPCEAACAVPCRVYLHSGEEHFERTDLEIPGRGDIHFVLRRSYRSRLDYEGPLGYGWDFSLNEALFVQEGGNVRRANGKGHVDEWTLNEDGTYSPPSGYFSQLMKETDGTFVMRSHDGFLRRYDGDGRLREYRDRHGNTMSFDYDERGNLAQAIDAYGRVVEFVFETSEDGKDRLVLLRDFIGREVIYRYDENGDLVEVRSPVVTGTTTGNDFPDGKTERYAYSSGHEAVELNHNLLSVTRPEEVANGGPQALTWSYGEDPADPATFDKVVRFGLGGGRENASGVPAGGDFVFEYLSLSDGAPMGDPDVPRGKARITERNGNVKEYFVNELHQHILTRRLSRGLRPGEPEFFETRSFFDADNQLVRRVLPEGNEVRYAYGKGARFAERNVVEVRRVADAARGGGEDLVTTFSYEPLYNQLASVTDPRGNAVGFHPPLGAASATRYTTRFFYDYQESAAPVAEAERWGIDLSAVERGLGDLNSDGRTDQAFGNPVRTVAAPVELLPDSTEAVRLGSTKQEIVTETQWNDRGQVLRSIDPEGNVTLNEYYPAVDPDGDGAEVATPRASDLSGYLRSTTEDAEESPRRSSAIPPTVLTTTYRYDPVGNVIGAANPRGVVTEIEVNQLDQAVVLTRGADVVAAVASGQLLTGEEAVRYQERRFYDHNDRLVRIETENRQAVSTTEGVGDFVERTFAYDLLDNLVRETVEVDAGETLAWEKRYDENELPAQLVEPEGNRHELTYDERNLVFRVTRGAGSEAESTSRIDYDRNGHRSRVIDAEDNDGDGESEATRFTYDGFDRLSGVTDAIGNETVMSYDPASNVVREQVTGHPPGEPSAPGVLLSDVRNLYDELNRLYRVDRALFVSEGFEPNRPIELADGNSDGFVTERFEYDRDSRVTVVTEDDLEGTLRVYDGADRSVEEIDAAGNRTLTEYDRNSNATLVTSVEISPEGLVPEERFATRYVYDQLDRLVRVTDNLGQTTRFGYDSRDNLTSRSDPEGAVAGDPLGVFTGQINGEGNTKTYFYDGLDRRVRQVCDLRVDGRGGNPLDLANPTNFDGQVSLAFVYDGNSRLVALVDDNGHRTTYGYDALNRKTFQRNADGEEYTYTYDRDDNLRQIVDPNVTTIRQSFDALNRLVSRTIARGEGVVGTTHETYGYDGRNRLVVHTDDNGAAETTTEVAVVYDSLSRVWEERQSVSTAGLPAPETFIRGDANTDGRYDVSDAVVGLLLLVGVEGPCLDAADSNDDGMVDTSDVVYTLLALFVGDAVPPAPFGTCETDPTQDALRCGSYPPCDADQEGPALTTGVISTVWSGDGKRLACTYPGGRRIANSFDEIDRVTRTTDARGLIAESSWIGPGYRELRRLSGNGTRLSYLDDAEGQNVGYDGVQRVVRLRGLRSDGTAFLDREYGYNRAGMRTFERRRDDSGMTDRYTYDSLYRMSSVRLDQDGADGATRRERTAIDYILDGVGNRRSVDDGSSPRVYAPNEVNEYAAIDGVERLHDANGNLSGDGQRVYSYDYRNRLVRVARAATGEVIARYLYHADNRRAVKIAGDAATLYFYDGWQVCEERGATDATYVWSLAGIDDLVQMERAGEALYVHQNARADVVSLTANDGTVAEEILYDDFGNPASASSSGNPYLFQGRRLDEETGLYYFRHRYYDPQTGRFLQRDPVWDEENAGNQYTFVGNGPASRRDAMGLETITAEESLRQFAERERRRRESRETTRKRREAYWDRLYDLVRNPPDDRTLVERYYTWDRFGVYYARKQIRERMANYYRRQIKRGDDDGLIYRDLQYRWRQEQQDSSSTFHFGHMGSAYSDNSPELSKIGLLWSGTTGGHLSVYIQSLPNADQRRDVIRMDRYDAYDLQMRLRKDYGRFSLLPLGPEPKNPYCDDDYDYGRVDPPTMEPGPETDPDKDEAVSQSEPVYLRQ